MQLKFKHNVFCPTFRKDCRMSSQCPFALRDKAMVGRVIGPKGEVLQWVPPGTSPKLNVSQWLQAAGMQLDDISDAVADSDPSEAYSKHGDKKLNTYRYRGFVLVVDISYSATKATFVEFATSQPPLQYDVRLHRVPLTTYKRREALPEVFFDGGKRRNLIRRSGFVIRVAQSGQCSKFSGSNMLQKFGVNMALMAALQGAIEFFWQFVYPIFGVDYNDHVYSRVEKRSVKKD